MDKRYLLLSASTFPKKPFLDALKTLDVNEVTFLNEVQGEFTAPAELAPSLDALLQEDYGCSLAVVAAHEHTPFEDKLLHNALRYLPNRCCFPGDVIIKEISFGDFSSYAPLVKLFKEVPAELMLTAGTYLRCGLDACLSAKRLGVHRNTFNYRLNGFIRRTNLDIRDYHNALLLELYFGFAENRF